MQKSVRRDGFLRRFLLPIVIGAVVVLSAAACGDDEAAPASDGPLKVAFLYSGPVDDMGWTQSFDEARQELESIFGDRIETTYKENLWDASMITQVMNQAILDGADVIVGTSYEGGQPQMELAAEHPDVYQVVSQWDNPGGLDNFVGYVNAPEDGAYISGVAAGHLMGEGETAGWVDAFPIPYDIRTINAFALGLTHSNPTATVRVVFTNDWNDVSLMTQASLSLIDSGVTFLASSMGGPAIGEPAESAGIPHAGTYFDARPYAPEMAVMSAQYTWAPMLEEIMQSILDGNFDTSFKYEGMSDGAISLTDWGPLYDTLSAEAQADIEAELQRVASTPGSVFIGPLVDIHGEVRAAEGEVLDVAALRSMSWVLPNVEGVETSE